MTFNKKLRAVAGIGVLLLTVGVFIWYFHGHSELLTKLRQVNPGVIGLLLLLYGGMTAVLMLILYYSLRLCKAIIPLKENALLTIYSSIVNFFGPLQSGPGFRAIYLKQRWQVKYKDFVLFSLLYYGFFALFSALFLFGPSLPIWLATIIIALVCLVVWLTLRYKQVSLGELALEYIIKLALATLLQVALVALIYFVELRSVDSHASLRQAVIYTGAANFALFVSLTPGAIGFRESFLLLAHRLHHIPNNIVIAASVIDRAVYLVFLGILFVAALSLHAKDKLQVRKVRSKDSLTFG